MPTVVNLFPCQAHSDMNSHEEIGCNGNEQAVAALRNRGPIAAFSVPPFDRGQRSQASRPEVAAATACCVHILLNYYHLVWQFRSVSSCF